MALPAYPPSRVVVLVSGVGRPHWSARQLSRLNVSCPAVAAIAHLPFPQRGPACFEVRPLSCGELHSLALAPLHRLGLVEVATARIWSVNVGPSVYLQGMEHYLQRLSLWRWSAFCWSGTGIRVINVVFADTFVNFGFARRCLHISPRAPYWTTPRWHVDVCG